MGQDIDWVARDVRIAASNPTTTTHERFWREGPSALTEGELLSLLFGNARENALLQMADNLIAAGGGLKALCQKDPQELCALPGMGQRRAAQVAAALELGRRVMRSGDSRPLLRTPEEIYAYLAPSLCGMQREVFHVLCLNARNALICDVEVARGTINSCPVDPRDVFRAAVNARACGIVLAHNHPSGDPIPSASDLLLTRQLVSGAQLFCIRVLDHVVFGDWAYASMAQRGELSQLEAEAKGEAWLSRGAWR